MSTQITLGSTFTGELITPEDDRYDEARSLFNGAIDKRPALIARCASTADVQAALPTRASRTCVVAVRGGGHSTAGHSCCDDGIVIDVGPIKHAEIDADARTGRFGAGLNWGELDAATQEHGLAITGGRVTHTGVAGYTLGSGSGWLERKYGPDEREPDLRRGRHRRRAHRARQRRREPGPALGPQGRRRELRRRHRVRVPAAPRRADHLRRDAHAPALGRARAGSLLPRLHGAGARRGRRGLGVPDRAARGVRARGGARQAGLRRDRRLRR